MRAWFLRSIWLLLPLITAADAQCADSELQRDPSRVRNGLVVSVDPLASRIGAEILHRGGNAVDAAVATGFALAVTHPAAGNLGGGGFMVVRLQSGETFAVDYREKAPRHATPTMFLDDKGNVDPKKVNIGWVVVGVPGSPMGLWTAHQKAGKLPWKTLVAPAVRLAEEGFTVDAVLARSLMGQKQIFKQMGEPARVYFDRAGDPPKEGSTLRLPELARTLRLLMEDGPDGFYKGDVADKLDRAMRASGGLVRKEDLADYEAKIRDPVRGEYRGHEIISICPPSSGGTVLIEMLNMLEGYDVTALGAQTPASIHLFAEVMKRAYYDRAKYLGDPDFVDLPLDELLSKKHAEQWRTGISDRATRSDSFGADILTANESSETTHFSVIDRDGNMVSNTTTLEGSFGAKVIAPGTGFLLNNEMHDFNVHPGVTNTKGLVGTSPNLIAPGKRMLSSQTPTLVVKDGKPFLILGTPGGRTIINTVLQVIVNVIDHRMDIQSAVDAGRVHHQWQPDKLSVEKRIGAHVLGPLRARGHVVGQRSRQGDCHAILIDGETGWYRPGIDRRIRGAAFGF